MLPENLLNQYQEQLAPYLEKLQDIRSRFAELNFKSIGLWGMMGLLTLMVIFFGVKVVLDVQSRNQPVSLVYWGLEDQSVMQPIIDQYQKEHPKVTITYVQQSLVNYRTRLQTQLQTGAGPDIFRVHASWLPMFQDELASVPSSVISPSDYGNIFYPSIKEAFTFGNQIYALPIEVDGLGMYVNTDILKAANVTVPRYWSEFRDDARKMTVKDQNGQIQTSGAAMGTTGNIDFWPEILATLFLQQPNTSLTNPATPEGADVLKFYTSFATDQNNKTWDSSLASSTQMFEGGRLAFYFAPSSQAEAIKKANPSLNFQVAPVPRLPEVPGVPTPNSVAGDFWGETVSARSSKQTAAWEFLEYLASAPILQTLYKQEQTQAGLGRPYPRPDLQPAEIQDPILGAFVSQAPNYKNWYLNYDTQDGGINDEMMQTFAQAVNDVVDGQNAKSALQTITPQINQILFKYYNPGATLTPTQ